MGWGTVADFSAQAVVNTILSRAFPEDHIVGEEDAKDLRGDSQEAVTLRDRVVSLAVENLAGELGLGEMEEWGLGPKHAYTQEQLLDAIDRGGYAGGAAGSACVDFIPFVGVDRRFCCLRDVDA